MKYILIGLLIIIGLFISQCPSPKPEPVIVSDTTIVYKSDTIKIYDTLVKTIKIFVNKPITVYLPVDSNPKDSVLQNIYTSDFEDSIIVGKMNSIVEGKLIGQMFNYKLKIPILTTIHDSIFTTINTIHPVPVNQASILLGAESGGNINSFDFSLLGGIHMKNNWNIQYRYGTISKTHNVSVLKSFPIGK